MSHMEALTLIFCFEVVRVVKNTVHHMCFASQDCFLKHFFPPEKHTYFPQEGHGVLTASGSSCS